MNTLPNFPLLNRPHHSRIQPLNSYANCYIKREDELGFGISGNKLRKYLSLVPALLKESPEEAIVIGSAHSNHVLSMTQVLIEHKIAPLLFLLGSKDSPRIGNLLLSSLFVDKTNIHWFSKKSWDSIEEIAQQFALSRSKKCIVVPRGANCIEALPGAMTLGSDIAQNEEEAHVAFQHLFVDSGTGLTAVGLILATASLKKNWVIHVILTAGNHDEFRALLNTRSQELEILLQKPLPPLPDFHLHLPTAAKSFGATDAAVFRTIREIACQEGFLLDPIYNAKLLYEGRKILSDQAPKGPSLFIHSGGALSLMGFQKELQKEIEK